MKLKAWTVYPRDSIAEQAEVFEEKGSKEKRSEEASG